MVSNPTEHHLIQNVKTVNRYETPDLMVHNENKELARGMEEKRHTSMGVRSMNTYHRLPPIYRMR